MATTLLVPLDLSDEKPPELDLALRLGRALSADVLLLHVIDYVPTVMPVELPAGYKPLQIDIVREAAEDKIARIAASTGYQNLRTIVAVGGAAAAIVEIARREKADQIIIGSHSHKAITRLVLGSVADRVAHTATVPVTIVREVKH